MSAAAIDTTVLIAAIIGSEAFNTECQRLVEPGGLSMYGHGFVESFNTLTGGSKTFRLLPDTAHQILEEDYAPRLSIPTLTPQETFRAMRECKSRGVRGGAIYDFLHLVAARKAKAPSLYTLNVSHFQAFHRAGDPEIVHP